ncbi:hypothetical protein BJX61DRAFT_540779 [Aspergillus egyptiacus]|nr:hypothetical protein BJX61DRAFT_540779 [Aspergillus egyptiacus]
MLFHRKVTLRQYFSGSSPPTGSYIIIGLVVDDVLNTAILRNTWSGLMSRSFALGGKVVSKMDTRKFILGDAVDFAHRTLDHDLKSYLPFAWRGQTDPTILLDAAILDGKFSFNTPTLPDHICRMRVTVLKDATLPCFAFVHGLFDGESAFDMVRFFCDLLSEKSIPGFSLAPDVSGTRMSDLVRMPATTEPSPCQPLPLPRDRKRDSIRSLDQLICHKTSEAVGLSQKFTERLLHFPGAWVDELRRQAQQELDKTTTHARVQLTRNDIIAAVYLKMLYSSRKASHQPVYFRGALGFRPFLQPPPPGVYYHHDSVFLQRCDFSTHQVQTESIAKLAERIRRTTLEFKKAAVIKQEIRFIEDNDNATNFIFQTSGSLKWNLLVVSPWTTFKYTGLDFSGASRTGRKPAVILVHPRVDRMTGVQVMISLKDGSGGYWIRATNTADGWSAFETSISRENLFGCDKTTST